MGTENIIGHDSGLKLVLERAKLVARSDVPVLILGETGSGKEVFSRFIHEESRRVGGPFLKVNCGAIPPELIDSYLFGYEKGAFTGATDNRKGWFERANGGTLLLDEIGELPLAAQVRFLRVLQDGCFEPVGGSGRIIRVDVRVIAATHRNLRQMVKEGTFREDLWYRISVFPIRIPPLRERIEDIRLLAEYFIFRATQKFHLPEVLLTQNDIEILENYSWPGNVRQLQNVIERAVLLGKHEVIVPEDLPADITGGSVISGGLPTIDLAEMANKRLKEALTNPERQIILEVLEMHHWNRNATAEALGINRTTLYKKMKKLGLDEQKALR